MTLSDARNALRTPAIPRPRAPRDYTVEQEAAAEQVQESPVPATVGELPWPEPWHVSRGARPRSEYWDTATWHSRGPIFRPHHD
jgi:hypothetical protein